VLCPSSGRPVETCRTSEGRTVQVQGDLIGFYAIYSEVFPCCLIQTLSSSHWIWLFRYACFSRHSPETASEAPTLTAASAASTKTLETVGAYGLSFHSHSLYLIRSNLTFSFSYSHTGPLFLIHMVNSTLMFPFSCCYVSLDRHNIPSMPSMSQFLLPCPIIHISHHMEWARKLIILCLQACLRPAFISRLWYFKHMIRLRNGNGACWPVFWLFDQSAPMWHSWLEFIYANRILSDQYTHLGLRDNGRCDCGKNSISYPLASKYRQQSLWSVLQSNSEEATDFRSRIRSYNSALCYTSFAHRPDPRLRSYEHSYIFQLQGTVYHYQGPLESGLQTPYSQLYFFDSTDATTIRGA